MLYKNKNYFFKIFRCALTSGMCFLIVGCVSTIKMTPQEAEVIKRIEIDKKVSKPKNISYLDQKDLLIGSFFPGLLIVGSILAGPTDEKQIQTAASQQGIKITKIVRNEMINQLKQNGRFTVIDQGSANATLNLEIRFYGFSVPSALASKLQPILCVVARLTRAGKVLWQDKEMVVAALKDNGMPRFDKEELLKNPENIYFGWDTAAKEVSRKLIKSLTS